MILVRGPWYEIPDSPDLPFVLNQSMSFPGLFKLWDLYVDAFLHVYHLRSRILLLYIFFVQGKAGGVNWKTGWRKLALRKFRGC